MVIGVVIVVRASTKKPIFISKARVHNLKGFDLTILKDKLVQLSLHKSICLHLLESTIISGLLMHKVIIQAGGICS